MKKKSFLILVFIVICVLAFSACSSSNETEVTDEGNISVTVPDVTDLISEDDNDSSYTETGSTKIALSGTSAAITGSGATASSNTVTISKAGTYIVSGSMTAGRLVVSASKSDDVQIVLSDAAITSADSSAIYVIKSKKTKITLEGSSNLVSSGNFSLASDDNIDGAVFSKTDLTINGEGSLTVSSVGHGIVCKDSLVITSGIYNITSTGHALDANDNISIGGGSFTFAAGKDGLHCENNDDTSLGHIYIGDGSLDITAGGDGLDASATLQIGGGKINITAGGGSGNTASSANSMKGIKSDADMSITAGEITVNSADDAIHSNGAAVISGGTFSLSTGDDGIHSDGALTVSGGDIAVSKSYEGLEGKSVTITGGNISIVASDDGINANGGADNSSQGGGRPGGGFSSNGNAFIVISGGNIYINASGDGIDSNGALTVSGGSIVIDGTTGSGDGTLDSDGTMSITGGSVIGVGSSGMAQNFGSASTQGSIMISLSSVQNAGISVTLEDDGGNKILSHTSAKRFQSVIVSHGSIEKGKTYKLYYGSSSTNITMPTSSYIYTSGSRW